jgi:hypothetical protein
MPIGSGAQYERPSDARTANLLDTRFGPAVNAAWYSHPIYQARSTDPTATVTANGSTSRYQMPAGSTAAQGSDKHLHVIQPDGRTLYESWLTNGSGTNWTSGYLVRTDLQGPGMGQGGVRAYGGSAIGGLIRNWELNGGGIRHALAIGAPDGILRRGQVWPATVEDGNSNTYYGQVPMGSLAAIPPSVDIASLGLSPQGRMIAQALQDYGAYLVDRAGTVALFAEPSLEGSPALNALRADWAKIRAQLRVVTNNGPSSVGGGGTPRAPLAPPFAG